MKRRQFLGNLSVGVAAAWGLDVTLGMREGGGIAQAQSAQAQGGSGMNLRFLGHTSFLFSGGGQRVLVNPYRSLGCTAGYKLPNVASDLVLISSRLLDEGFVEGLKNPPQVLFEPGVYQVGKLQIQGIRTAHDRVNGRRFGTNVAWRWTQGGLTVLHLGGVAAPIAIEQKILMGTPDVLCIPVGGGPKAYTAAEAKQAIAILNPKVVIPTHYRTAAADAKTCDLQPLDNFLGLMGGVTVRRGGSSLDLRPSDLPKQGFVIQVMSV